MACKKRAEDEVAPSPNSSPSLSEALLFATLCIVGMPVDVHVKDGSVFSGIFYTASVDGDYGIVLKKAKLTRKGRSDTNVASESEIETLVILSADLVQVVAKRVLLPSDGFTGSSEGENVESHSGNVSCSEIQAGEVKKSANSGLKKRLWNYRRSSIPNETCTHEVPSEQIGGKQEPWSNLMNGMRIFMEFEQSRKDGIDVTKDGDASDNLTDGRQTGESCSPGKECSDKRVPNYQEEDVDIWSSSPTYSGEESDNLTTELLNAGSRSDPSGPFKPDNKLSGETASVGSLSLTKVVTVDPESCQRSKMSSNKSSKEFKLNPGAKDFSPSFLKPVPPAAVAPLMANLAYIPNCPPLAGVCAAQPDGGINSFTPPMPSKYAPYGNFSAGNNGSGSELSQSVVGHVGNRTHPIRYAPQYHPIQAAPVPMNSNSQVMVGRLGQLFYVQSVAQDFVPGTAAIPPLARPMQQVQMPKHQGTATGQALQVCLPQHYVDGGQPPYAIPAHAPVLQPVFPANRQIPVPCSNGFITSKFP